MTQLFLLLLALFLFPVAVYCTLIGMINRRPRPLMVAGTWDFLGVLMATSGFLLFVGPALLSGAFRRGLQELPFQRDSTHLSDAIGEIWAAWWVLWILYYLFVLAGAAFLIWTRRDTTILYNVDPHTLDGIFGRVAQRLGLEIERRGNRLYLAANRVNGEQWAVDGGEPSLLSTVPSPQSTAVAVVDVEAFALLSNVSLHWVGTGPAARADLERELRLALAETIPAENSAGSWLLGTASLLFIVILLLTAAFIAIVMINYSRRT